MVCVLMSVRMCVCEESLSKQKVEEQCVMTSPSLVTSISIDAVCAKCLIHQLLLWESRLIFPILFKSLCFMKRESGVGDAGVFSFVGFLLFKAIF